MSQDVKDTTGLSALYHLNSEPWVNENPDTASEFVQAAKSYLNAPHVPLPPTQLSTVDKLATARRSTRAFADEQMPMTDFAALLRSGYRAIGPDKLEDGQAILRRPVPSAGGLYPLELYALVQNVEDMPHGIYHYDCVGDGLAQLSGAPWQADASRTFLTWPFVEHAATIICVGTVFDRTQAKYGPRGYRYALLEAGHVGQNLALRATELGLGTLFLGGFRDSVLNRLIGLDGRDEAIVYAMAVGQVPAGR